MLNRVAVMKLVQWRKGAAITQDALAELLGCSQPYVSQIERSMDPTIPRPDLMVKIFLITQGAVSPNDFYDLPVLDLRAAA